MKFRATQAGYITGIRFYKGSGNTGTHVGSLWSKTGTLLGRLRAFAAAHPNRLRNLIILNAPHPAIFARELRSIGWRAKWNSTVPP